MPALSVAQLLDPFSFWREALNQFEQQANALGNQSLRSPEMTKLMHQFSTVSSQLQSILEMALAKYFKAVNLPSRKDVQDVLDAVRALEERMDGLLGPQQALQAAQVPRPARTRRPPAVAAAPDPSAARAAEAAPAPSEPRRKSAAPRKRREQ